MNFTFLAVLRVEVPRRTIELSKFLHHDVLKPVRIKFKHVRFIQVNSKPNTRFSKTIPRGTIGGLCSLSASDEHGSLLLQSARQTSSSSTQLSEHVGTGVHGKANHLPGRLVLERQ